ncbi:MAG: 30S ribosomal protein S3 [Candidatus Micrarchaeia archaeon]
MVVERKFIEDSILRFRIAEFMKKQLSRAGFSNLTIQKTPMITLITAETVNPGRVIGRHGKTINDITEALESKFKIENPKINISPVSVPDLEPQVVARKLVRLIEIGKNPRRMMHFIVKSIMDAGAIGCEVVISGKLAAKGGRAKTFRVMAGYLPKAGEPARWIKSARMTAYPKAGAIGVCVKIAQPGLQFPDKKVDKVELPAVIEAAKDVEKEVAVETETSNDEIKKTKKKEGVQKSKKMSGNK